MTDPTPDMPWLPTPTVEEITAHVLAEGCYTSVGRLVDGAVCYTQERVGLWLSQILGSPLYTEIVILGVVDGRACSVKGATPQPLDQVGVRTYLPLKLNGTPAQGPNHD